MKRDFQRLRVYQTEWQLRDMFDAGSNVRFLGTEVYLPPEGKFGDISSIQSYVDKTLEHLGLPQDVTVRERQGELKAHYEPQTKVIAVPTGQAGKWAQRELVILHEVAHHIAYKKRRDRTHGPVFVDTYATVLGQVMDPAVEWVYRVIVDQNKVCYKSLDIQQ